MIQPPSAAQSSVSPDIGRRFFSAVAVLLLAYALPLYQLAGFALHSELYSHILLVPLVSVYLAWTKRPQFGPPGPPLTKLWSFGWIAAGLALAVAYLAVVLSAAPPSRENSLALAVYSFDCLLVGSACFFLGRNHLRLLAFPLAFLVFLAPLPSAVEAGLEHFLQHGSALAAHGIFRLAGTPVFRAGTYFRLPGFSMEVAPECSGIHSTLALFLTSLVAGQLLLRRPWSRVVLAAVVLPIALLRNGFRVFTIGELCVHVGPHMIDSYIHRHGGPIFFVLSLIPFSAILYYLFQSDRKANRPPTSSSRA
jgi:exosortase C (VPDSG-CTERM-specific)